MQFLKIWFMCVAAAVLYGIIHDQITARVCVEYFTIGHPPVFHTSSPTLLAFGWGLVATWWMGAFLGLIVALCARSGSDPKLRARDLLKPMWVLLAVMGISALCAGVLGYVLASKGQIPLRDWEYLIGREKAIRFIADFCAHLASYLVGFFGGLTVCVWILVRRVRSGTAEAFRAEASLRPGAT